MTSLEYVVKSFNIRLLMNKTDRVLPDRSRVIVPVKKNKEEAKSFGGFLSFWFGSLDGQRYSSRWLALPNSFVQNIPLNQPCFDTPALKAFASAGKGLAMVNLVPSTICQAVKLSSAFQKAFQTEAIMGKKYDSLKWVDLSRELLGSGEQLCSIGSVFAPLTPDISASTENLLWTGRIGLCLSWVLNILNLIVYVKQLHEINKLSLVDDHQESETAKKLLSESKIHYVFSIIKSVMSIFTAVISLILMFSFYLTGPVIIGLAISALAVNLISLSIIVPLAKYHSYMADYKPMDIQNMSYVQLSEKSL